MSLQWFHDGVPIPDANADLLVITNVQTSDAGNYSVVLSQLDPPMDIFSKPAKLIGPVVLQTNQQFIYTPPGDTPTT